MTPIDVLDKQLLKIRDDILNEQDLIEQHNTQIYEAKLRLRNLEAERVEFENTIIKLKGK